MHAQMKIKYIQIFPDDFYYGYPLWGINFMLQGCNRSCHPDVPELMPVNEYGQFVHFTGLKITNIHNNSEQTVVQLLTISL